MKLKRIVGLAVLSCLLSVTAEAAQINTIIDTGSGMFAEPEKVYSEIDATVKSWFYPSESEMKDMNFKERLQLKDAVHHTIVPTADSDAVVQIYREEKGAASNMDTMVTGDQARDVSMTRDDLANLSKELGADYIIYFRVTNSAPTITVGFMSAGQKTNVTTDFRVWEAKQEKYVFIKRYQTTGKSSSFYMGMGSASHAVQKGLDKALEQITKDKDKILEVIK